MKKKITSAIALGIAVSNIVPIVANAQPNVIEKDTKTENLKTDFALNNDILQKYPKLKIIKEDSLVKQNFSKDIYEKLDGIINELHNAMNTKDMAKLEKVIEDILEVHTVMEYDDIVLHAENDQIDYILFNSIALIFELTEGKEEIRNEKFVKLIDDLYVSSVRKFNKLHYGLFLGRYAQYMNKVVSEYLKDDRTKEIILNGFSMINSIEDWKGMPSNPDEDGNDNSGFPTFPEEEKPSVVKPDVVPPPPVVPPEEEVPPIKPPVKPPEGGGDYIEGADYEEFEFVNKNGVCYKVVRLYTADGVLKKTIEEKLPSDMNSFCGIYDNPLVSLDEWNENNQSDISTEIWNSLAENDLNQMSNNTLQFTINKNAEKPYYYDTGIKVSSNDTATFTQLKDTLLQLITKTKAYVLEDKDRLMFIAEGKPLIVIDKQREYSSNDISSLLNGFNELGLKIDEKKSLEGNSLEDKFANNELSTIKFKDENISLSKNPQLKDGALQLPVLDVAKVIGYNVEDTNEKVILTAKKDNQDIKIEVMKNSKDIIINGVTKKTLTSSNFIDGTLFAEMNLIIKELGYKLIFDIDLGTVEIK